MRIAAYAGGGGGVGRLRSGHSRVRLEGEGGDAGGIFLTATLASWASLPILLQALGGESIGEESGCSTPAAAHAAEEGWSRLTSVGDSSGGGSITFGGGRLASLSFEFDEVHLSLEVALKSAPAMSRGRRVLRRREKSASADRLLNSEAKPTMLVQSFKLAVVSGWPLPSLFLGGTPYVELLPPALSLLPPAPPRSKLFLLDLVPPELSSLPPPR